MVRQIMEWVSIAALLPAVTGRPSASYQLSADSFLVWGVPSSGSWFYSSSNTQRFAMRSAIARTSRGKSL